MKLRSACAGAALLGVASFAVTALAAYTHFGPATVARISEYDGALQDYFELTAVSYAPKNLCPNDPATGLSEFKVADDFRGTRVLQAVTAAFMAGKQIEVRVVNGQLTPDGYCVVDSVTVYR